MHPALLLLLRLRRRAFWRRALAGMKTARGMVLLGATATFFALMLLPQFLVPLVNAFSPEGAKANQQFVEAAIPVIRTVGPLALLFIVVLFVATSLGEAAIYFTPADVDFLFPGPFSRRELLYYKLIQSIRRAVLSGTFLGVFTLRYAPLMAGAWLGTVLTLLFINAFTLALTLLGQTVSQHAYSRWRQAVLVLVAVLIGLGLAPSLGDLDRNNLLANVTRFRESLAGSILLAPFDVFPRIVTAHDAAELSIWTAVGSAMVAGLFGLAIGLDTNYLETAQQVSQRVYERIQRRRQAGGGAFGGVAIRGAQRLRLPRLPWLFGVGPNLWRQWLLLARRSQGLVSLAIVVIAICVMLYPLMKQAGNHAYYFVPVAILGGLAYQSMLASMQLPTGFRGDLDRIDWLKALPLHPTAVVCAEIAAAALLLSLVQTIVLLAGWALFGGAPPIYLSGLALLAPVNLFCFGIENLVFLVFPIRAGATTAGDFQFMGKFMLLAMLKMLLLFLGLAVASAGAIVYLLVPQLWLAVGCALALLLVIDAIVVSLATVAFMRFDVSLDTPPA